MRNRNLYRPYIRRANGREISESLAGAVRLAFYRFRGRPFYVLVQRGFPRHALAVGPSRASIENDIVWLNVRKRYGARFRHYAKAVEMDSHGTPMPAKWPPPRYDSGIYGKSLKGALKLRKK
jgi:hypothetical protein